MYARDNTNLSISPLDNFQGKRNGKIQSLIQCTMIKAPYFSTYVSTGHMDKTEVSLYQK